MNICINSFLPLRAEPDSGAEMVSQLVFGDRFRILENRDSWNRVERSFDKYQGWIGDLGFVSVEPEMLIDQEQVFFDGEFIPVFIEKEGYKTWIRLSKGAVWPFKTLPEPQIPFNLGNGISVEVQSGCISPIKSFSRSAVIETAFGFLGVPYLWGGNTTFGFDCSGLVQTVFRLCGYAMPRDAKDQQKIGISVSLDKAQPGDLVFFHSGNPEKITHVGILISEDIVLHASGFVKQNQLRPEGLYDPIKGNISHYLHSINTCFQ